MTLCEFCILKNADGQCAAGRNTPQKMRCVDFTPGIERFCGSLADYKGRAQLQQMAVYLQEPQLMLYEQIGID